MTATVVGHLILKDWRLHRRSILASFAAGLVALLVLQRGGEVPFVLGSVWFFVALIVLSSMLPILAVVNERKNQTLAFVMSLPVSSAQYTLAKVMSTLAMFLIPWLTLLGTVLLLIEMRSIVPRGSIPMVLILTLLPVAGFCLILGAALVGESEGWAIAATVVCNSSYGLIWYLLARLPALTANWSGHVAVWNPAVMRVLSAECGLIFLSLGFTLFLQSRKRDFI